jgi:hypothetical protein
MGAIYGLVMFGVAFWFHTSVIQENQSKPEEEKENAIKWFVLGAIIFLAGITLGYMINYIVVEGIIGGLTKGVGGEGIGEATGGDTGIVAIVLEFVPLITAGLAVHLVRSKYVTKKPSGILDLISGISLRDMVSKLRSKDK